MTKNIKDPRAVSKAPGEILLELVDLFERKGWPLNRSVRVKRRGACYNLSCSHVRFLAYRINDFHALSPGVPGWPACAVNPDRVFCDAEIHSFSDEPGPEDWLWCIANNDFEVV